MAELSSDLFAQIVRFCEPHFRLPADRDALLIVPLRGWDGYHRLDWAGSPHVFTVRLVELLPPDRLQAVLQALPVGHAQQQTAAALCGQIDADQGVLAAGADGVFTAYHQAHVRRWSQPPYRYDSRFVQLTLLLDKGPDTPDLRFVPDGRHHRYDSLSTLLQEVREPAYVLLGSPGCGKTTLLRHLQLETAWAGLKAPTDQTTLLAPLSGYAPARPGQPPPEPEQWLARQWQQLQQLHPTLPAFATLLRQGRLLLLLDGLNEIPHQDKTDYRERIALWRHFLQHTAHCGNTIVFSCRSLDYSAPLSSETLPVRQVRVEPLTPAQIETFLDVYLADAGARVWQALRDDARRLELFANPFFLRLLVDEVADRGTIPDGQAALLTGFVYRALKREINEHHHRLFEPRAQLLSDDDYEWVTQEPARATPYDLPEEGPLLPRLAHLAFTMQDQQTGEGGQVRVAESAARQMLDHPRARDLIAAGIQLNVLDKDQARREILFFHQLIQEYFAARVLARRPQPERAAVAWRADELQPALADELARLAPGDPLPPPPATGWEETTLMAAAMSADPARFVADLLAANLPLAARCAASPEVATAVPTALRRRLQTALLARIADPTADLRARIAAAEALGELGDPRFERRTGPHGDYLLPPLAAVRGGTYPIGDDDSAYKDERPAHQVAVAGFEMGVFPVTNAEYALFMAAGGYAETRWWQTAAAQAWLRGESGSEGIKQSARDMRQYLQDFSDDVIRQQKASPEQIDFWLWLKHASTAELERQYETWYPSGEIYRQPRFWDDSRFDHPARPVVGVSWFEARAYCAWLAAQLGCEVRLPTEVEWEAAAAGMAGRAYAYGPDYDASRCNTFETHVRRTTPVGVFPDGRTPEGIHDLSGNVWEWTSTIWGQDMRAPDYPYPYDAADGREDPEDGAARRVVRGGSWGLNRDRARAGYRDRSRPGFRDYDLGFRLVVVRRSPSQDH